MSLRAIILAVDGVLAETHEARREAFNKVFAEAGVGWDWGRAVYAELIRSAQGGDMIGAFVTGHIPRWRHTNDLTNLVAAMKRRHATIYSESLANGAVKLRPGMAHFLCAAARSGVRLAVATRERRADIEDLLQANLGRTGAAVFEVVEAHDEATEAGARSPHARVVKRLSLSPRDCLAIESSAEGLGDAIAVGLPSVITWGTYPQVQECAYALFAANDASPASNSSMIMARWDPVKAAELLVRLNDLHATHRSSSRDFTTQMPARSLAEKELEHVGG